MAITISAGNIGPIRSASVTVKPLTVFVGANNSGKSVLATVVYAALQKRRQS
jgi:predicted ATPase